MNIQIDRFFPLSDLHRARQTNEIVFDLIVENGFRCAQYSNTLKECVFEKDSVSYQFKNMEFWSFSPTGDYGLHIDSVHLECITVA